MDNFLIIDTSTKGSSVTLVHNKKLWTLFFSCQNQTKEIIPLIRQLLLDHNFSLKDISKIGVCVGPGLFTGTRVGVMTAKTLSYTTKIPLCPFSTFDLFIDKDPIAILDAKCERSHLYSDGEISLIQNKEIPSFNTPVYTLDNSYLKEPCTNLVLTKKDLSLLLPKIMKQKGVSHSEIDIYYTPI